MGFLNDMYDIGNYKCPRCSDRFQWKLDLKRHQKQRRH